MKEIDENTPWYKQPLVWMVIMPPLAAVIAGIITINIAIESDDGLVVDDYYKQGLGINQTLHRDKKAWEMGLKAKVTMDDKTVSLKFLSGNVSSDLRVKFIHPTQGNRDIEMMLTGGGSGSFHVTLPHTVTGNWDVLIEPEDKLWRLMGRITLPQQQSITLLPGYSPG